LRFIYSFSLFVFLLLIFEYFLVNIHVSKSINCEHIGAFAAVFASKETLQRFHTTFGRSPTSAEYWRFVIFAALFAITIQAILVLVIERNGKLPPISVHVWLTGFIVAALMLGLVALGYSGWMKFDPGKPKNGSIRGKSE